MKKGLALDCIPSIVSNAMNETLIRPISLSEVGEVVFGMKKGKALGPNGYPIKVYQ